MVKLRYFAVTAALVGIWLYRSLPTVRNSILYKAPLPAGYAFNGDYDTGSCEPLGPGSPKGPFDALSYCEDIAFWDLHKDLSDTHPKRLLIAGCDPNRKSWNTVMGPLRDPNPHGSLWVMRGQEEIEDDLYAPVDEPDSAVKRRRKGGGRARRGGGKRN
ncbi:hypothetical protein NMY22_g18322 [Coprinellus aureogranulatus]|nr:hypothetical protein NMY22_g18322 [Coprinellus aureogranulatus]